MTEEKITEEMMDQYEEDQKDDMADDRYDDMSDDQETRDTFGYPEQEERQNPHTFLHKATFGEGNTIKTTFLTQEELGRPLFNIRFLLDMEDIAKHYLKDLVKQLGTENKVADYFINKAYNVSDSGMSREGFTMGLNVTRRMDMTRRKEKNPIENLQGGKRK